MTRPGTAWTVRVETFDRDWRHRAVCAQTDPEVFFPIESGEDGGARVALAKRVCAGCPVRSACLTDVMGWEDPARRWGVVAGLTAGERAELFAGTREHAARLNAPASVGFDVLGGEAA